MRTLLKTTRFHARCREDQRTIPIIPRFLAWRATRFLPLLAAVCLLLTAGTKPGHAQSCPSDTLGGTSSCMGWDTVTLWDSFSMNDSDCFPPEFDTVHPKSCCIEIQICFRCCNDTAQAFIKSFTPWNWVCDTASPQDMLNFSVSEMTDFISLTCGARPC
ncbi:MAG TPA: hypothetical protein VGM92_10015, partial [Candidatus Kapabacteria bacterium]